MALDKQIHLYSLATDTFYTNEEQEISNVLSRLYSIRTNIRRKKDNKKITEDLFKHQLKRLNKIIKHYKKELIKEFENTRKKNIIRELNPIHMQDKNVVSIFESSLTRSLGIKTNNLTKELMIVQIYYFEPAEDIIKNGFIYDNEKYILFSSSAGQIRTKKIVMIKQSSLLKIKNKLTCGLDWDIINSKGGVNANKYLAYYSLNNSATEIWEEFDIDKAIVVEDFETMVNSEVDFIDDITYDIERRLMDVPIPHTDGCGIKISGKTQMIRMAWFKGLMGVFRFDELVLEWREKYNDNNIGKIKDIYGKEYDVITDGIEFIFTKSQFKMWKYYDSWKDYKSKFKEYGCEACICNVEEDNIKDAKINYQMLQTLSDIKPKEMEKMAQPIIKDIDNLGNDYRTMMKILGVNEKNPNLNAMQKSLLIYPELMRDRSNRMILKDCQLSLIKNAKAGKLPIKGKYTFVLPDLYAFCEWLFLDEDNPKGILNKGEVYCSLFKNNVELNCLRSPHLFREHAIRNNTKNDLTEKWFIDKSIYTSTQDLISKILQFDVDGDKLLVVSDKTLCRIAKRNMKDIVPLYYDMKKAPAQIINTNILYDSLEKAYKGGKIGLYSNNISKIWNSGKIKKEQIDVIKMLCMENNFCIDMAKTLYMPSRPKKIDTLIKKYTKLSLPYYFIYAKDKKKDKVAEWQDSPINMLDKIIPSNDLRINTTISKLDYKLLLSNMDFVLDNNTKKIIKVYDDCNTYKLCNLKTSDEKKKYGNEDYIAEKIKNKILELNFDKNYIIDTLIMYLYTKRKQSIKKTLWECFGDEIYNNLQNNTQSLGKICPICGKRFNIEYNQQVCCSKKCQDILDLEKYKKYNEKR